jgi:hypothetical protein
MSGAFPYHDFIVCSSSRLVPSYLHHGTQRGVQSMGSIFIPRDLNIEHRDIRCKLMTPKERIMSAEISPKTESDAGTTLD